MSTSLPTGPAASATPPPDPSPPDPSPIRRRRPGLWTQLRPLVLRLHFAAALFVGPFIALAALTGLMYTVTPQLESVLYRDQLTVAVGSTQVPLSLQVQAARAAHPEGDILSVTPPIAADSSTRVVFSDAGVPDDDAMTVFVDPYTGQTLGQVQSQGQWLGVRAWIDQLHRDLHLGQIGRLYSELAASWLWVVVLGGVALWFGRRHRHRRDMALPAADLVGRARTRSWHAVTGVWITAGLLALSVSGLTWSTHAGERIADVRAALDWTVPAVSTALAGTTSASGGGGHDHGAMVMAGGDALFGSGAGIDGVYATALAQGLRPPMKITPPSDATSAWTVGEVERSFPVRYDTIAVDPMSGQVIDRVDYADWPVMAQLTKWVINAHMGTLFGVANQLVLAALAIGLLVVMVLGYRMWWQRRPTGGTVGRPYPRGSLHRLTPGALLLVGVVTALSAWFVPLLGITLSLFLAVDVVLGARQRARAAAALRAGER